jgi:hypothetical protein
MFQERLNYYNNLDKLGFREWVFYPDMLFDSSYKWWGSRGKREKRHEGLDLCLYRNKQGHIHYIEQSFKIPVLFDGQVVKIEDDFLGESVFIGHSIYNSDRSQLYTIYGHIKHSVYIHSGDKVSGGDVIGVLADIRKSDTVVPHHLHLSIAWIKDNIKPEEIGWQMMGDSTRVVLSDPLHMIQCPYSIVPYI